MLTRRLIPHAAALAACLAAALWITYPAIVLWSSAFIGHPFADHTEYIALIDHYARAVAAGQSPFFLPAYLYPHGLDATLLWAIPLQSFPAWALLYVMPPAAAFNTTAVLFLVLNGYSVFVLLRGVLPRPGDRLPFLPALIGAIAFTCAPAVQGQLGAAHIGLIALFPAPLFALALHRLATDPRRRGYALAGVCGAASMWGSVLLLVYIVLPIWGLFVLRAAWRRDGISLRRMIVAGGVTALCAAPFLVPFALTLDPRTAEIGGAVEYSAPLVSAVAPSFYHPLYASLDYTRQALGVNPFELAAYLGLVPAVLAVLAAWKAQAARPWLIAGLLAYLLALGPLLRLVDPAPLTVRIAGYSTGIALPYALLQSIPPISLTRTPARFNLFVALAVSVATGWGAAWIAGRLPRTGTLRRLGLGMLAALVIVIPLEQRWWWPLPMLPAAVPPGIVALADRENVRAVFDIPFAHPLTDKYAMYWQTAHRHPLIGGHVARRTPLEPARGWLLETTLDPALLHAAGIDVVIVHRQWAAANPAVEGRARDRLGDPFYADADVALYAVPVPAAPLTPLIYGRFEGRDLSIYGYLPPLSGGAGMFWMWTIPGLGCPRNPDPTTFCRPPGG